MAVTANSGELANYYHKQTKDRLDQTNTLNAGNGTGSIEEIGIERTGCFGRCPIYTFIIRSDGSVRYNGLKFVARKGVFTGQVSIWYFHQLSEFIHDSGYMELKDSYSKPVTDLATVYTTVVINGNRKVISHYANAGSSTLWAVEQLIDKLLPEVLWHSAPK